MSDAKRLVDAIVADPQLRAQLAEHIHAEDRTRPDFWSDRAKPFIAGLSSALVVLLAFLVPSIQDLRDRLETRRAVDRYAEIGRELMARRQYTAAEAALDRAIELAGSQRLDLMELRMQAHVQRMEEGPEWPGKVPESLSESDFLYVLAMDQGPDKARERAAALGAYATFLAEAKRWNEAEQRLREALQLRPDSADLHVLLGNVLGDRKRLPESEAEYRRAINLDPRSSKGHYDLGLLLADRAEYAQAEEQFRAYVQLKPDDPHGYLRLAEVLGEEGRADEAQAAHAKALELNPAAEDAERDAAADDSETTL